MRAGPYFASIMAGGDGRVRIKWKARVANRRNSSRNANAPGRPLKRCRGDDFAVSVLIITRCFPAFCLINRLVAEKFEEIVCDEGIRRKSMRKATSRNVIAGECSNVKIRESNEG